MPGAGRGIAAAAGSRPANVVHARRHPSSVSGNFSTAPVVLFQIA